MATSSTSGKISGRNPLDQLTSEVWFAIITQTATGNKDYKVNLDVLRQYMQGTAKSSYDLAVDLGFQGTVSEWLATLAGKSAYQIAVDSGSFTGTEAQWVQAMSALYSIGSGQVGQVLVAAADGAVWRALTKNMVGLDQVDNTPDLEKPISRPMQDALDTKLSIDQVEPAIVLKLEDLGLVEDNNGDLILDEGRIAAAAAAVS